MPIRTNAKHAANNELNKDSKQILMRFVINPPYNKIESTVFILSRTNRDVNTAFKNLASSDAKNDGLLRFFLPSSFCIQQKKSLLAIVFAR